MSLKCFNQTYAHHHSSLFYNCITYFTTRDFPFCWVRAHVGIKGNEANDKAAKQACNPFNSPISYSDIKLTVQSLIRQKWPKEWDAQTENKLKEIKPFILIWPTFTPEKLT